MEADRGCTRSLFKGVTPFGSLVDPNVDPHEFDTELAAVWYAANYYFETSYNARREFGGIVFRKPSGKYGLTIQRDGTADAIRYRGELAPPDAVAVAFWHTHVPKHPLYEAALTLLEGKSWRDLSGDPDDPDDESEDIGLIRRLSKRARKMGYAHQMLSIYVVTDIQIQRYTPNARKPLATWAKSPPSHFARRMAAEARR